jgi:hypothetical protein
MPCQDVISYEITSLSPVAVKECVPGEGQLLGDMFMIAAFTTLVKHKAHQCLYPSLIEEAALDAEIKRAWQLVQNMPRHELYHWAYNVPVHYRNGLRRNTRAKLVGYALPCLVVYGTPVHQRED